MRAVLRDSDTVVPITVDGQPVQVLFDHFVWGDTTYCTIRPLVDGEDVIPFSEGEARCSSLDHYDKCKGRYIAWKRAVETGAFTKEEKANLWSWYTSTCKLPDRSFTASLRR